jgi:hypothetical protein
MNQGAATMLTARKSTRITISGTTEFKAFLFREAQKEGITVSELVRQRCKGKRKAIEKDEVLAEIVEQLRVAVAKANASMNTGLQNAESVLAELRSKIRS